MYIYEDSKHETQFKPREQFIRITVGFKLKIRNLTLQAHSHKQLTLSLKIICSATRGPGSSERIRSLK